MGKVKNVVFGKKDPGVADKHLALDKSLGEVTESGRSKQKIALDQFAGELSSLKEGPSSKQLADITAAKQERQIRAGSEDRRRKLNEAVAQRGLGGSSVGLRSLLSSERDIGDRIGAVRASTPALQQQFQQERIGRLRGISGGINQILGTQGAQKAFVKGRESTGRSGGLAKLGLTAAGAYFGGAGGAQAGAGAGKALANL